jgi:hypothetical protein
MLLNAYFASDDPHLIKMRDLNLQYTQMRTNVLRQQKI